MATLPEKIALSIIIPVFNTAAYLRQCLDSLVAQTQTGVEIICIDNGSTDGSQDILEEYSTRFDNMKVLNHHQGRQGAARNAGLQISTGAYVGFVDSDDFVHPDMFRTMLAEVSETDADICVCNIDYFYQDTEQFATNLPTALLECKKVYSIEERPRLLRNLTVCNKIFSSRLVHRLGLRFPEDVFHEDQYFVSKALLNAKSIVSTPKSLYFYRKQRPGSVSNNNGSTTLDLFKIMNLLAKNPGESGQKHMDLLQELTIHRTLQLYATTSGEIRRKFFHQLKSIFLPAQPKTSPRLLTPSECREFRALKKFGYRSSECFYLLRKIYGRVRS